MQVCVLGPLLIRADGSDIPAGSRLQRRVLARLAMDAGRPVSVDDLEQAVWADDPPSSARHTIATHVFRLRKLGLVITTTGERYVLGTRTDVDELERLVATSNSALEAQDLAKAAEALRQAVSMWRGQPLD